MARENLKKLNSKQTKQIVNNKVKTNRDDVSPVHKNLRNPKVSSDIMGFLPTHLTRLYNDSSIPNKIYNDFDNLEPFDISCIFSINEDFIKDEILSIFQYSKIILLSDVSILIISNYLKEEKRN